MDDFLIIMMVLIYIVVILPLIFDDDKKQKITVTKEGKQVDIEKTCPVCQNGILMPTMLQNKYKCNYCNHVEYNWNGIP